MNDYDWDWKLFCLRKTAEMYQCDAAQFRAKGNLLRADELQSRADKLMEEYFEEIGYERESRTTQENG